MSRSSRLLNLLQALRGRHFPVTATQLADELEVSERTIYRDIAELIGQGAQIAGEAGVGYIMRPGFFLPPMMFTEGEVEAVLLGLRYVDQRGDEALRTAAAAALAKISAVLPPLAQAQISSPVSIFGPPSKPPSGNVPIDELRAAVRGQRRLDISYEDQEGHRTGRIVWPVQLGFMEHNSVLAAWCELCQDFRTFRTDRIISIFPLDRYPGRRSDLVLRLRNHLEGLMKKKVPANAPDRN